MLTKPLAYAAIDAVPEFLSKMSVEITAKQADKRAARRVADAP